MSDSDEVNNYSTDPTEANTYSCYTVWAGTEEIDDCGVCSGGSTGLTPNDDKDICGVCNGSGPADGQYATGGACYDITAPSDGFYISTPATSSSDNLFSECTVCADGYYASTACSDTTDTVCELTVYQPADRAELLAAVDLWDSDRDSAMNSYGHISTWDVSQVVHMTDIFNNHQTFNDDISNWDTSNATNMRGMFSYLY